MTDTKKIEHRKSATHIHEHVERFAVAGLQGPQSTMFSIAMGRDAAEVVSETLDGGQLTLNEDDILTYRLDVATITMSETAARGLVELLSSMLANQPKRED
ncbi:hypothetical protein [Pseudomonas lutea]|jgi:hypothetical protein|uniref:Uncharacterized protein n=1 Tax=Pseudomonas lutea TaxID=243924 RepID=A0A9X0JK49_9PSED|nr:hypothetical protein [Pseudomonas lutea]KGF65582.1 hypothetical protein LT42_06570 [Pseudomonas lutea]